MWNSQDCFGTQTQMDTSMGDISMSQEPPSERKSVEKSSCLNYIVEDHTGEIAVRNFFDPEDLSVSEVMVIGVLYT